MNKIKIGNYILKKRKELNITQEQLSEKIGVSSKTVSKWECGKSLPDYSVVEKLCKILKITTTELLNGEDNNNNIDEQMIDMLKRIQKLEIQKTNILGILLMIMGIAIYCMSQFVGGTNFQDFISGFLLGMSIVQMLVGIFITVSTFSK